VQRRAFLTGAAAAVTHSAAQSAAESGAPPLIRPKVLHEGDTVGLITPSTFVSDPDRVQLAVRTLEYFKLRPKLGKNVTRRTGYPWRSAWKTCTPCFATRR
jgi:muramoyltetrapeptide carboxypeptidase